MENTMPSPVANIIPYQDAIPKSSLPSFCPMLPPVVRRLRDEGKLRSRDVDLISLLMGYKNDKGTLVWPSQATLAARLHVRSVDTVQRCLRRIIALGLVRRVRERAERGKFDKVKWDLAALWADLDRHLEKSRLKRKAHHAKRGSDHAANFTGRRASKGIRPSAAGDSSAFSGPTMPQTCGPEAEPESVEEADNGGMAGSALSAPPSAVVVAFRDFSLGADDARSWESKLGEAQCLEAARITAAQRTAKKIGNLTGYLIGVLKKKAEAVAAQAEAAKALAVKALAPKPRTAERPAAPATPDVLDVIPQDALTALERCARAELVAEQPGMRAGYEGGKYAPSVRARMRKLVIGGWLRGPGSGEESDPREETVAADGSVSADAAVPTAEDLRASLPPIPAKYLSAQDLRQEWDDLPDQKRSPFRDRARREVEAAYAGGSPRAETVESRAYTLFLGERKKPA